MPRGYSVSDIGLGLGVPEELLNVYMGHEFDSFKSKNHRAILAFIQTLSGKSNGPQTLISNFLGSAGDSVYKHLADVPNTSKDLLWIPEASIDQWPDLLWQSLDRKSVALGPSVDVFNQNVLLRLKQSEHLRILVPSIWVKELFIDFCGLEESRIYVWAAGVDHEYWKPDIPSIPRYLTLYKKTSLGNSEMSNIIEFAENQNLELKTVQYGDYKLKHFRELLRHSRALVYAGSTESQGLAQFEAWAMNVPTLIRKARNFSNFGIGNESPYLSELTGMATREGSITTMDLIDFSARLASFRPREWIVENATSRIARENLLSVFKAE